MKNKIRGKTMMKKIRTCVVLILLAALLLSGCYMASPSDWLPGRGDPSRFPSNIVSFGAYNGNAIDWSVLDNSGGNLLLVSANILDERAYHSTDGTTWSECDMRTWLNGDFYDAAFTDVEKSALLGSDKVTLLTLAQAENPDYFGNDVARTASTSGTDSTYWLTDDGGAAKCVTDTGAIQSADATDTYGVRPVICISGSAIAQLIDADASDLSEGELDYIEDVPANSKLALWDDTLPSISISSYALDRGNWTLTVNCSASSSLAPDEKVYAYFTDREHSYNHIGCSSLSNGQLIYNDLPGFMFDVQLAVVKPSSTASDTYSVGPASTLSEPISMTAILGIEEGGSYLTGQSLDFTAVGANGGDFNWVPESWSVGSQNVTWSGASYTGSMLFSVPGDYTLAVTFQVQEVSTIFGRTDLYEDTRTVSFHVLELSFTASPANGNIYTGGSIALTPNVMGGTWEFDSEYLSRDGNVFTGLKVGTTTVTYTVDGQSKDFTVNVVDALSLTASPANGNIYTGESITLTPNITGGTWGFDSEHLSRTDSVFTGLKEGETTVTYTAGGQSKSFDVTVKRVLGFSYIIYTGESITLAPNIEGGTWDFDSEYLSRDGNVFTGLKEGTTTVTYTADAQSESFTVTVKQALSLAASPADGMIHIGESITLASNIAGGTWDFDSAFLSRDGNVFTGIKAGTTTVKYTADGQHDTCTVTVVKTDVTGVTLSSRSKTMAVGEMVALSATVLPSGATYPDVTWASSNTDIVTVDSAGKVTAKDFGFATITAEADGVTAVCTVSVVKTDVTGVTLSSTSKTMDVGDTATLSATVNPSGATYPDVTWKSTNTSVARVDQSGKVTAVSEGAAAIIADADGTYAVSVVLVSSEPEDESDDENDMTLTAPPTASPSGETEEVPDTGDDSFTSTATKTPDTIIITIVVGDLPEGTTSVKLPSGEVVELDGSDTIQVEVGKEDVGEDGSVEIVALDDEGTPLGAYAAETEIVVVPDTASAWERIWPVLMWVLIGIAGIGVIGGAAYLVLRKRQGV